MIGFRFHHSCATAGESHPFPLSYSSVPLLNNKKSPVFFQDRGLIEYINPHIILTPKTVRGHPDRSSGSPIPVRLPSLYGPVAFQTEIKASLSAKPGLQRRVRSRFKRDSLRLDVIVLYVRKLYNTGSGESQKVFLIH